MKILIFCAAILPLISTCSLTACANEKDRDDGDTDVQNSAKGNIMHIQVGNVTLIATLAENSSAEALKELLSSAPVTINMRDYGNFEKVGALGATLPENNERITTQPGDLILYQGTNFVIYYAPNTWSLTRLGKINNVTQAQLKETLGEGNVTVTLSLP